MCSDLIVIRVLNLSELFANANGARRAGAPTGPLCAVVISAKAIDHE